MPIQKQKKQLPYYQTRIFLARLRSEVRQGHSPKQTDHLRQSNFFLEFVIPIALSLGF